MHVTIHTAALPSEQVAISNDAAALVRMGFNPSTLREVDAIKALAAALVSACETMKAGPGGREAAIAITHAQTAAMFAVAAATAGRA